MNWRAWPTEPGLYLRKQSNGELSIEDVVLSPTDGRAGCEYVDPTVQSTEWYEFPATDRFLGPLNLAELEAWLLGRPS